MPAPAEAGVEEEAFAGFVEALPLVVEPAAGMRPGEASAQGVEGFQLSFNAAGGGAVEAVAGFVDPLACGDEPFGEEFGGGAGSGGAEVGGKIADGKIDLVAHG